MLLLCCRWCVVRAILLLVVQLTAGPAEVAISIPAQRSFLDYQLQLTLAAVQQPVALQLQLLSQVTQAAAAAAALS
jgi:hypothetical protein